MARLETTSNNDAVHGTGENGMESNIKIQGSRQGNRLKGLKVLMELLLLFHCPGFLFNTVILLMRPSQELLPSVADEITH